MRIDVVIIPYVGQRVLYVLLKQTRVSFIFFFFVKNNIKRYVYDSLAISTVFENSTVFRPEISNDSFLIEYFKIPRVRE